MPYQYVASFLDSATTLAAPKSGTGVFTGGRRRRVGVFGGAGDRWSDEVAVQRASLTGLTLALSSLAVVATLPAANSRADDSGQWRYGEISGWAFFRSSKRVLIEIVGVPSAPVASRSTHQFSTRFSLGAALRRLLESSTRTRPHLDSSVPHASSTELKLCS